MTPDGTAQDLTAQDLTAQARTAGAGFTLIEVVIALGLFALIAAAGVAMLGSVLRVQRGTAGQLDRLGDFERALLVITDDFTAIADAPIALGAQGLDFRRRTPDGARAVRYALAGNVVQRTLDAGAQPQRVLGGVGALHWQFYVRGQGWVERWPLLATPAAIQAWPAAVAVDVTLSGTPARTLRRIVLLPVRPLQPGQPQ